MQSDYAGAGAGPGPEGRRRFAAGTIVARNYLGFARVLQDSFCAANPDIEFTTLVIDAAEVDEPGSGLHHVLTLADLGLSTEDLESMMLMYDVTELATALKPALLQHLLGAGYAAAAYFDPDVWVRGDLRGVFDDAVTHGIVLTPHTLAPVPRDGLEIQERTIMRAGIFNLGFIAVGESATTFLQWWHDRLRTDAVVDFDNALFTDQRWIDWVPALFGHVVSRDPGLNVAYWNLHERPLSVAEDGTVLAAGAPLRFFHFSGFDTTSPWSLSRFTGEAPRVLVSEDPVLQELCSVYADLLEEAGHRERRRESYGLATLPGGPELTPGVRKVYRSALIGDLPFSVPPAQPWKDPEAFRRWLTTGSGVAPWCRMAPAEWLIWSERPDLQSAFPKPFGSSALMFRRWLDAEPYVEEFYRGLGLPGVDQVRGEDETPAVTSSGWNVVVAGFPQPSGEVSELAGRVAEAAAATGVPVALVQPHGGEAGRTPSWTRRDVAGRGEHGNVIVCIDVDHYSVDRIVQAMGEPAGRCVAVWLSSESAVGDEHRMVLDLFDEIWVLGTDVAAAVAERTSRPVRVLAVPPPPSNERHPAPVGVDPQTPPAREPAEGKVLVLEVDARGDFAAQNPLQAIEAFKEAFTQDDDVRLLVDVRHGEPSRRQIDAFMHAIGGRTDIVLSTPEGSGGRTESLIPTADGVISLHRASAVTLPVLTALEAGTAVITCAWSGVCDQLDGARARLIAFERRARPAPQHGEWAVPDLESAVKELRLFAEERRARFAPSGPVQEGATSLAALIAGADDRPQSGGGHQDAARTLRRTLVAEHDVAVSSPGLRAEIERLSLELASLRSSRLMRGARLVRGLRRSARDAV